MIFAAATDENTLYVFPSAAEATAYCEGIDVDDGGWRFWDESGSALSAVFLTPNHRGRFIVGSGTYRLAQSPDQPTLAESLPGIGHIDGNPYFATLSAVQAHLVAAVQASQHGA